MFSSTGKRRGTPSGTSTCIADRSNNPLMAFIVNGFPARSLLHLIRKVPAFHLDKDKSILHSGKIHHKPPTMFIKQKPMLAIVVGVEQTSVAGASAAEGVDRSVAKVI